VKVERMQRATFPTGRSGREHRIVVSILLGVLLLIGILAGVIFAVDPMLDLQTASFFHDLLSRLETSAFYPAVEWFRHLGPLVVVAAIAPAVLAILVKTFMPKRRSPMSSRAAFFLVLSLALGPGLLVNGVLKPNWPRARPYMVTQFGGEYHFTPWWDLRGTCDSNCSFVSGEVSAAAWLAAPAMVLAPPWSYVALGAVAVYGAGFAFIRLLAGGHFLSDVIFAGVFTGLVIWAVHGFLFRWPATRLNDRAIDAVLERIGDAVLRVFGAAAPVPRARPNEPTPPA
jgi:lipid A 4'-phosphatase